MTEQISLGAENRIFVNRTLNMNYIRLIGFDMDYTLATYNIPAFEELAYSIVIDKLINQRSYPAAIRTLKFDPQFIIRGLVIDTELGNILKVNRYGYVKKASHGTQFLTIDEQKEIYNSPGIDFADPRFYIIHTSFSLAEASLYAQLVDFFEKESKPVQFKKLFQDVHTFLDEAHQEGNLKECVARNPEKFLVQNPKMVEALKKLKFFGKKLALITNSDYEYSKVVMGYCFTPFLDIAWQDMFDLVIVASNKPAFFQHQQKFLKVDRNTGLLSNLHEPIKWGEIYQGGNARTLERDLGLPFSTILYIGDHIYGDVVQLKKTIGWRTCLVVQELETEVSFLEKSMDILQYISSKMLEKEELEDQSYLLKEKLLTASSEKDKKKIEKIRDEIREKVSKMDDSISELIVESQKSFNPYWGEVMRAGNEESRFATMVERYACIYTASVANFTYYSPFKYFRPRRRYLAHDPIPLSLPGSFSFEEIRSVLDDKEKKDTENGVTP